MDLIQLNDSQSSPLFSIGVTTYDRKQLLIETLHSIIGQTFFDFEVIVGNDNPQRILTAELLGIYDSRIRFVNHAQNLGEVRNMNKLLNLGRGKYFTWLADDDLYETDFLYEIFTALMKFNFPPCIFTSYSMGTIYSSVKDNSKAGEPQLLIGQQFLRQYLRRKLRVLGCYGVFDTKYLRRIGGMEQLGKSFSPYSDNLLAIRCGLLEKIVYIDRPLVYFRSHEDSISYTNPDVDAYSSAHNDLWSKSIEVFKSEEIKDDFRINLFLLLKWCLSDYCAVMYRSGVLQYRELIVYLLSMKSYIRLLGNHRYKMVMTILHRVGRLIAYHLKRRMLQIIQNLNSNITNH